MLCRWHGLAGPDSYSNSSGDATELPVKVSHGLLRSLRRRVLARGVDRVLLAADKAHRRPPGPRLSQLAVGLARLKHPQPLPALLISLLDGLIQRLIAEPTPGRRREEGDSIGDEGRVEKLHCSQKAGQNHTCWEASKLQAKIASAYQVGSSEEPCEEELPFIGQRKGHLFLLDDGRGAAATFACRRRLQVVEDVDDLAARGHLRPSVELCHSF
mmetsp:Transcript_67525/g.147111  ORF Transcript_67525/g.147111 Transcript_67525/m.147111 type:complete len:214 (-) Transcript_67525:1092-1733(-)